MPSHSLKVSLDWLQEKFKVHNFFVLFTSLVMMVALMRGIIVECGSKLQHHESVCSCDICYRPTLQIVKQGLQMLIKLFLACT